MCKVFFNNDFWFWGVPNLETITLCVRARERRNRNGMQADLPGPAREVVRWLLLRWKLLDGGRLLENL